MQEFQFTIFSFHQRRRHKLYRALASVPAERGEECEDPRNALLELYEKASNKDNQISQLDYYIKHELGCDFADYSEELMEILWQLLESRSGRVVAFIVYRLCRKYPCLFWRLFSLIDEKMKKMSWDMQKIIFCTDLFLFGFPFTLQDFSAQIFPNFRAFIIKLIPKYLDELQSSLNFPARYQKMFRTSCAEWFEQQRNKITGRYLALQAASVQIQNAIIKQQQNENELINYESQLQGYEMSLHCFYEASGFMEVEFNPLDFRLKTVFDLRKECQTFKVSFVLSSYQQQLYMSSKELRCIKPVKKHEMLKLSDNEAFLNQIKLCSNVRECINLSGYFLEQMNLQRNREQLVQTIINDCYHYNNLSYILKIIAEIGGAEPSMREYCRIKGRKICSTSKMNPKYQKLLCEMTRFNLIEEGILLEYCEKILKNENHQTTREVESILEHLGTLVYYRSLATHIRINALFERIEGIIKGKLIQFNTENLYQLKGLMNYLQNHQNSVAKAQTRLMAQFEIQQNFEFILGQLSRLVRQRQFPQVLDYIVCGVNQDEYLTSYYYASLLRELSNEGLEREMHKITVETVLDNLKEGNNQKAVNWSRFLGELYNYECMSRRDFFSDLQLILRQNVEQGLVAGGIKCVCAGMDTSKSYLQSSNAKREKQLLLMLLNLKAIYLRHQSQLEYCLICQVKDLLEYFNPLLLTVLNSEDQIYKFIGLFEVNAEKNLIFLSSFLSQLAEGLSVDDLRVGGVTSPESKKKYRQKQSPEKSERKWRQKKEVVEEKVELHQIVTEFRVVNEGESISAQSWNALQSSSAKPVLKKMKITGRSTRDNKIKTTTIESTGIV